MLEKNKGFSSFLVREVPSFYPNWLLLLLVHWYEGPVACPCFSAGICRRKNGCCGTVVYNEEHSGSHRRPHRLRICTRFFFRRTRVPLTFPCLHESYLVAGRPSPKKGRKRGDLTVRSLFLRQHSLVLGNLLELGGRERCVFSFGFFVSFTKAYVV